MRTRYYSLVAAAIAALFGLTYWRNKKGYPAKNVKWWLIKSFFDTSIITLAANFVPAVLVAWCSIWVARPIKSPAIRVAIGILSGLFFEGLILINAIEVLCAFSIFAVDLVTGTHGFLGEKKAIEREEASYAGQNGNMARQAV